ncbi:hypothetical protein, partial [Prevotella nigrescens]|uniref:hypothetical protein n=1 Tax=Prevotella nigrescens TaxID=28133 RepID=UPI00288B1987
RFVRIIPLKSNNGALVLQKCLSCDAKQPLLPCKRTAFTMLDSRYRSVLTVRQLRKSRVREECLQFSGGIDSVLL